MEREPFSSERQETQQVEEDRVSLLFSVKSAMRSVIRAALHMC